MPGITRREFWEKAFPGATANYEGGATKSWDDDPRSRGGWTWFRPGEMSEFWPFLAQAEGRVHFAGEHTSPWPAWMQSAVHSGVRAAREVNAAAS
jgi:monoamine oxidase